MRRTRARLLAPVLASGLLLTGCGSESSSTTTNGPDSPGPGPVPGARVLPLISMTGGGGRVSPRATLLDTASQLRAFTSQFRPSAMTNRVDQAVAKAHDTGYLVFGAVIAVGCDVPPGATVAQDTDGQVEITPKEVASPLPECLAPVTTVAIAAVPGAD
jgi:hypothetical protein